MIRWDVVYTIDGHAENVVVIDTNENDRYDAVTQAVAYIVRSVRISSVTRSVQQPQP